MDDDPQQTSFPTDDGERSNSNTTDERRTDDTDSPAERYRTSFDPRTESVSDALLTTVSRLDGRDLTALPVLGDCIDPEALDDLFASRADGTVRQADCAIFFTYADYEVRVESDGSITLTPTTTASAA